MIRVCDKCSDVVELDGRTSAAQADPFFCGPCVETALREAA